MYFIINKTMRKAVIRMFKNFFCNSDGNRVSQLGKGSVAVAPVANKVANTIKSSKTVTRY